MALHAIENLDDAFAATRAFLVPVDRSVWVRLAVVVLFVGSPGGNLNGLQFPGGGNVEGDLPAGAFPAFDPGPRAWLLIAAAVGALLAAALAVVLVGSVMEFVLVESLRREEVRVRRYWGRRWRQGLRLFVFRVAVGAVALAGVLLLAGVALLSLFGVGPVGLLALSVLLLPLLAVLAAVAGLVNGFTTVFVVPIMVLEDCGVLAGWRRLWPTLVDRWKQYLAYAVAGVVLSGIGGLLAGLVALLAALLLLVPFGILFGIGYGLFAVGVGPVGIAVMAVVGLLFGLSVLAVAALARVPVATYLRYYALLVLGDVDADLDLIPERRAAVRESAE